MEYTLNSFGSNQTKLILDLSWFVKFKLVIIILGSLKFLQQDLNYNCNIL